MTTHRPTRPEEITNPPGPKLVKNTDQSGAKSGDHTQNRDRLQEHLLNEAGWVVIRIWEHQQVAAAAAEVAAAVQECRARRLPQGAEVLKQVGSSP